MLVSHTKTGNVVGNSGQIQQIINSCFTDSLSKCQMCKNGGVCFGFCLLTKSPENRKISIMMGITGAFSSLNINERPPNTQNGIKLPKNRSTLSLPNLTSQTRSSFSPGFIRNNYCDDDIESSDQPIDFSKKYCETKIEDKAMKTGLENGNRNCTFNKVVKSYNNTFTMYAETDLDQPTDYSLRYAEDDSDSDGCNKIGKTETAEFVQDTIKTYCTEDTPYETPFNFSTSTSMSDLRIDEKTPADSKIESESKNTKDIRSEKILKSEFSSGLMSPEKPVNYCEEGTPGYFSRVASCGSLNSIPVNESSKQELKDKACDKEPRRGNKFPSETKAVKFEEVVNYAEETPLMFSRSSSLASLDSIEQHSIHDDRSSVISDFSRLTSGLISPSELPDSPTQTIPPSPKPRKNPLLYPQVAKKKSEEPSQIPEDQKCSVFEDAVKKFKMESTPLQFSTATSLSSLIDDHEEAHSKTKNNQHTRNENDKNDDLNNLDINNELSESSEDEDILAACINIGMQNNRYSQKPNTPPPPPPPINEVPNFKFPHNGDINGPRNSSQHLLITVPRSSVEVTQNGQKSDMTSDSVRTYCTEDTPAILSLAGSNSDLSLLSLHIENKIEKVADLNAKCSSQETDERSNSNLVPETETEENRSCRSSLSCLSDASHESEKALLQECILAGMPKGSSSPIKTSVARSTSEKLTELEDPESTLLVMQKTVVGDESSDEEDKNILADCISSGMKNNRYNQHKLNPSFQNGKDSIVTQLKSSSAAVKNKDKQTVMNDSVKSYYTEDTPVGLSHAGSGSDLSVLSAQVKGVGKDDLSDVNSNLSDDEDERLLMECVRYGMAKITGSAMLNHLQKVENNETRMKNYLHNDSSQRVVTEREKVDLNISVENNVSDDDNRSFSSISDESYESDQALLQECILAGMPKPRPPSVESNELTPTEKALLQQCILEGMRKCRMSPKNKPIEDGSDLTEAERALLRQCILAGMPKNKNLSVGGPSAARESTELTESERLLLQQCILAGMPKSRGQQRARQQWSARPPRDGGDQGHTCCIHCPRNIQNRMLAARQGGRRKRYRERGQVQVREGRDVNILYVTSQILAMKKEIVDRSHEEWV